MPNLVVGQEMSATFDVVTLNIWHDKADWPKRQALIVHELKRLNPDVIVLQEVLQHAGLPNQAKTMAEALGYDWYFVSVDPEENARRYGNAILSRHSIVDRRWARLQPYLDSRTVAHIRLQFENREIDVFGTHLHYTQAGGLVRSIQIRELMTFVELHSSSHAAVLAGDFNTTADALELRALTPRFVRASQAIHGDEGVTTLNPAMGYAHAVIDHVYFDPDAFSFVDARILFDRPDAYGTWTSDHFGVRARLRLQPERLDAR